MEIRLGKQVRLMESLDLCTLKHSRSRRHVLRLHFGPLASIRPEQQKARRSCGGLVTIFSSKCLPVELLLRPETINIPRVGMNRLGLTNGAFPISVSVGLACHFFVLPEDGFCCQLLSVSTKTGEADNNGFREILDVQSIAPLTSLIFICRSLAHLYCITGRTACQSRTYKITNRARF